MYIIRPEKGR